jgi:hypothetical protein
MSREAPTAGAWRGMPQPSSDGELFGFNNHALVA